jgi:hypothetical protein
MTVNDTKYKLLFLQQSAAQLYTRTNAFDFHLGGIWLKS